MNRVRIDIRVPGVGDESHEYEHCLLVGNNNRCRIIDVECMYGLTAIEPPRICPLRMQSGVTLRFKYLPETESPLPQPRDG